MTEKDREIVHQICGEISAMEYAGDMKAIAAVMIDKDGDVRTLVAYADGTKLSIIAGCAILQNQIVHEAAERETPKPRNI